jgi:hypothetical protein
VIDGFESSIVLVIPSLVELAAYRSLHSVFLCFHGGVPGDLPTPQKPVLQAHFILNDSRYRGTCVVTWATLRTECRQSLKNGAAEFFNTRVDSHLIVQFRFERNLIFQIRLEVGRVSAPEVSATRWFVVGCVTPNVNEYWEMIRA